MQLKQSKLIVTNKRQQGGFSLIELIIVIIILGVLSVVALPKLVNIQDDAQKATISTIGAAFKAGIDQVHIAWLIRGNGQAIQDFLEVVDPEFGNVSLSINRFGYPADTRGVSLTTNSDADCVDVWRAVSEGITVDDDTSAEFRADNSGNTCTYEFVENPNYTIFYDSNTGEVSVKV